ncbi:MAG: tetratricopeptide repeat protein [Rhodanobacter sp.]|jgi:Ca-activated chloride channel family protein|nr:tetratricopeptide repeat protein [Rhodanobacter sp.]
MNEALQQFHFLRPWWLLALALLPLIAWLAMRQGQAQRQLARLVDADLLPHLLSGRAGSRQVPTWLFMAGWTLAALALAGPSWNRVAQPLYASRPAQVVAISLSQHMLARDVAPSRLDRAIYKAHDLLASNRDGLNALIGYAGEAFVVAPLTSDADSLGALLDAMAPDTMPVDGNDAALAIQRGVALIHDANAKTGLLVLITDQADAAADVAARKANQAGVRVSVLGVGTHQGGPVPQPEGGFLHDAQGHMVLAGRADAALAALAAAGGGRYVPMTADQADITALHAELRAGPATQVHGEVGDNWQDRGPWLLLPLLLIAASAFRRGWLVLLALVLLPLLPGRAHAVSWTDLWQRPDQQALQALRRGEPGKALQLARDPAWRGAAAYRAGDYAAAAQALQQAPGSTALYNLGNALAKQGRYRPAIAAYDRALKLDPANADAVANRKAVEDWLRKKQKKQQQEGKNGQKSSGSKDGKGQPSSSGKKHGEDDKSRQPPGQGQKSPGGDGKDGQPPSNRRDRQRPSASGQAGDQPKPQSPQQKAEQDARTQKAQQALKRQMDQALAGQQARRPEHRQKAYQLGALPKDDPRSRLPADLRQALQRVADDPGALLRRKFALEYLQRHGGAPSEDQQP